MAKVCVIFGTRPEAIKLFPIINELRRHGLRPLIVSTGQHRKMLNQVLRVFDIQPKYDLGIMKKGQTLTGVTYSTLKGLDWILAQEKLDILLVQGDTTTTFAAALSACYHGVPVGHVEAGLRTYEKVSPYPEEINRQMVTVLADIHFAPTDRAMRNLRLEGVPEDRIYLTGNTGIDALLEVLNRPYEFRDPLKEKLSDGRSVILVTAHRRESFGPALKQILLGIRDVARQNKDVQIVFPLHLNPCVQGIAHHILANENNVLLTKPLDYLGFCHLLKRATLIITDSGGVQEEAPSLGKPVLVVREITERPEGVEAGTAKLVGIDRVRIKAETQRLLDDPTYYNQMARASNPYGDGHAAGRIVNVVMHRISPRKK
jgi:UDP-N-acetylglucosamine 2-epimerase (non-hydrolysing)